MPLRARGKTVNGLTTVLFYGFGFIRRRAGRAANRAPAPRPRAGTDALGSRISDIKSARSVSAAGDERRLPQVTAGVRPGLQRTQPGASTSGDWDGNFPRFQNWGFGQRV